MIGARSPRAPFTREEYERRAGENFSKVGRLRPAMRPLTFRGVPLLVKDYAPLSPFVRNTVGWFSVEREVAIYGMLRGLRGIPRFFGRIDAWSFAVERIEAESLAEVRVGQLPDSFFVELRALVHAMHGRGVVHGDLRQRRNILVGPDQQPFLIDFVSGLRLPPGTFLYRIARVSDLSGVAKLIAKHCPGLLTGDDRRLLGLDRLRPLRQRRKQRRMDRRRQKRLERQARRKACVD